MIIDGNVLVKMGIKPFFPVCQFVECLRFIFEGVNHSLSASFCGRVEGVSEPLQEAENELIMDVYNYDYLLSKDHNAIHLQRPTRKRVATILTGFRSARIMSHYRYRF